MGTNYYVWVEASCENPCDHCSDKGGSLTHLGKSSLGWEFSFRGYPGWTKQNAFQNWMHLAQSGEIEDEYGQTILYPTLLSLIMTKRGGRVHAAEYPKWNFVSDEGYSFTTSEFC
jgi:hypothetical protein